MQNLKIDLKFENVKIFELNVHFPRGKYYGTSASSFGPAFPFSHLKVTGISVNFNHMQCKRQKE